MDQSEIKAFLDGFSAVRERSIVIVDFANVDKWKNSLGWSVNIPNLAKLVKHVSIGSQNLRRFYYGSDYGKSEKSQTLSLWSSQMLELARNSKFELVTKRVKYILDSSRPSGFQMKCDLDVEMAVDLIKMRERYDRVFLFSGDGDLVYAMQYLNEINPEKDFYVFAARGHIGKEIMDAEKSKLIKKLLYADDFRYRLDRNAGRGGGAHRTFFRSPWSRR